MHINYIYIEKYYTCSEQALKAVDIIHCMICDSPCIS